MWKWLLLQYVLSVLNFTYPTIFQGWQTLVGGLLLRVLLSNKCLSVSSTELDKPGFISLLPSFLFFSAGIVASSKALAGLVSSWQLHKILCHLTWTCALCVHVATLSTSIKKKKAFHIYWTIIICVFCMLQSVPVYLCLQNSLGGLLYLVEVAPGFRGGAGPLLASLTVVISAAATVLADIDMTVYFASDIWLEILCLLYYLLNRNHVCLKSTI